MSSCRIESEINDKRDAISTAIKGKCLTKDYLQGHFLPPEQFVDVIINDYLETIIICYQTGSMSIFSEKLEWFKDMYSRRRGKPSLDWMLDMFGEIKKALNETCTSVDKDLSNLFIEMEEMIQRLFKENY